MDNKKQPLLLLNNPGLDIKSPIFIPRPGWGGKLKKWLFRHFEAKILPAIALAVLFIGIYLNFIRP